MKRSRRKRTPAPEKPLTPLQLKRLKQEWAKKLRDSGFKDLETQDYVTADYRSDVPLKGKSLSAIAKSYDPEAERHYMRLRTYVNCNPQWHKSVLYRFSMRLYAEGASYREIAKAAFEAGLKKTTDHKYVYSLVKKFTKLALAWNRNNPRGVDFEPDV